MTTPDYPMPYVVQFQAKDEGGRIFLIPPGHRVHGSNRNHYLAPGTYRIQVTWDGTQEVQLNFNKGRFWTSETALEALPGAGSAGVDRTSRIITVTVPEGFGNMLVRLVIADTSPPISASNIEQNNTATMMVYPSMNQGGASV